MTDSLYAAVNRRLVAFADSFGSGGAAALRLPSLEEEGAPFVFIPSPRPIMHLSASPYSKRFLLPCLTCWQRGDQHTTAAHSAGDLLPTPKSTMVLAFLLWFFLCGVGIHRFYLLRRHGITILIFTLVGVVYSTFLLGIPILTAGAIWVLIDLFRIAGCVRERNSQIPHG